MPGDERIRARTDHDLADCVGILSRVHEMRGYPVNWPDDPVGWLRGTSVAAWVAAVGDTCVGHVAVTIEADAAHIERLFVDPARSGTGLGRALLRHAAAEAWLRSDDVLLDVVAAVDAANGLYRADGWEAVSRTPIAWGPTPESMLTRYRAPRDRTHGSAPRD